MESLVDIGLSKLSIVYLQLHASLDDLDMEILNSSSRSLTIPIVVLITTPVKSTWYSFYFESRSPQRPEAE
jgi:hypothetical protein